MRRPWLTQPDEVYQEKGAWEELGDFEIWLCEKIGLDFELYDEISPTMQTSLYVTFCELYDELDQIEQNHD